MFTHETSADRRLQLPTEPTTKETVDLWRNDYRGLIYEVYPQVDSASTLIAACTEKLLPFLPDKEYQASLKTELEELHAGSRKHLAANLLFLATLRSLGMPKEEAFKAIALNDIALQGESIIYRALHRDVGNQTRNQDRLSEVLESVGVRASSLQSFGELNGVSLEADSEDAARRGDAAATIVASAEYFPSREKVEQCIFVERIPSGSARFFRSRKIILIGAGLHVAIAGEEYDLAERVRVLLHEGAHAEQSKMSQVAQEYSALDREISGITSINLMAAIDIPPYYWQDVIDWLVKLRDYADNSKSSIFTSLVDPDPRNITNADHNIAENEKENDLLARRLDSQKRLQATPTFEK